MSLTLDDNSANFQIRAFKPGTIQVRHQAADQIYTHSIIITPDILIADWPPQTIKELTAAHLQKISELKPTILLIGTGATLVFPELSIYGHLINQGIGVEIMDTSAACRTYNALTAENRIVAAALIIS
ncbi:MAG: Mth938-like domain-containing protein [Pseudomonadota bacterium]